LSQRHFDNGLADTSTATRYGNFHVLTCLGVDGLS
jgi:hypothetical protein